MQIAKRIAKLCRRAEQEGFVKLGEPPIAQLWKAFAGKPWTVLVTGEYNAGKSQLINALLGEERVPVGPTPTTRDFVTYNLSDGIEVIDTPGINEPTLNAQERKNLYENLAKHARKADLVLLVVSSGSVEQVDVYNELRDPLMGKRVIGVINVKDKFSQEEQRRLIETLRAKMKVLAGDANLLGITAVNSETGLRAKIRGSFILLQESRIEDLDHLIRSEEQRFRSSIGEPDLALLRMVVEVLEKHARRDLRALALFAEARVLQYLRLGAKSILLPYESSVPREHAHVLAERINNAQVAEIRLGGSELYVDLLNLDQASRAIVRTITSLTFHRDNPVVAIVGAEIRNCTIRRDGGDMFVLGCDLRESTFEVRNRADLWLGKVQLGDIRGKSAVILNDRSSLKAVDVELLGSGGLSRADATSTVDVVSMSREQGWVKRDSRVSVTQIGIIRLPGMPEPQGLFGVYKGYLYAARASSVLSLFELSTGRLCDQWVCRTKDEKVSVWSHVSNPAADALLITGKSKVPGAFLLTVREARWVGDWIEWNQAFDAGRAIVGADGSVWTWSDRQLFRYHLAMLPKQPMTPTHVSPKTPEGPSIRACALIREDVVLCLVSPTERGRFGWQLHEFSPDSGFRLLRGEEGMDGQGVLVSPTGRHALLSLVRDSQRKNVVADLTQPEAPVQEVPIPASVLGPYWLQDDRHIAAFTSSPPQLFVIGRSEADDKWKEQEVVRLHFQTDLEHIKWVDLNTGVLLSSDGTLVVASVNIS